MYFLSNKIRIEQMNNSVKIIDEVETYQLLTAKEDSKEFEFWKGVVYNTATKSVVARAFNNSTTIIANHLPNDLVYVPMYESAVLRFYYVNGKPCIGTQKRINIVGTQSRARVSGGRPFFELVKEAIQAWPYTESTTRCTPTKWEDLCIPGYCNVFLLVDKSTAITKQSDRVASMSLCEDSGKEEFIEDAPQLIFAMSLQENGKEMIAQSKPPMFINRDTNVPYEPVIPMLTQIDHVNAEKELNEHGGVIGFNPLHPDQTTKFISGEYAVMMDLVGPCLNREHRWHELMDRDPSLASKFLTVLPYDERIKFTEAKMKAICIKYITEVAVFLAPKLMLKLHNKDASFDQKIYNNVRPAFLAVSTILRKDRNRNDVTATKLLIEKLSTLPYLQVFSAHAAIRRIIKKEY